MAMVGSSSHFGTAYWSHLKGSSRQKSAEHLGVCK